MKTGLTAFLCLSIGLALGGWLGYRNGSDEQNQRMSEFFERNSKGTRRGELMWAIYETGVADGVSRRSGESSELKSLPIDLGVVIRLEAIADKLGN